MICNLIMGFIHIGIEQKWTFHGVCREHWGLFHKSWQCVAWKSEFLKIKHWFFSVFWDRSSEMFVDLVLFFLRWNFLHSKFGQFGTFDFFNFEFCRFNWIKRSGWKYQVWGLFLRKVERRCQNWQLAISCVFWLRIWSCALFRNFIHVSENVILFLGSLLLSKIFLVVKKFETIVEAAAGPVVLENLNHSFTGFWV